MINDDLNKTSKLPLIGVGLRHEHYDEALNTPANIDFIEVHAENFFAEGGASHQLFNDMSEKYSVSLHATSLGLGSASQIPLKQINQLNTLIKRCDPILVSDHACFSWADINSNHIHGGDLLPVPFNEESLNLMAANVLRVQRVLGRKILIENLSAYMELPGSTYSESEFLVKLCELTQCKLLIDLNNLVVNATNHALLSGTGKKLNVVEYAKQWLANIPADIVGEFHLAGCTPVGSDSLMIDDHSRPVSINTWAIYHFALTRFGAVPTLIEWDENLPSWTTLLAEASKAKDIAKMVFGNDEDTRFSDIIDESEYFLGSSEDYKLEEIQQADDIHCMSHLDA
ncbi:DUF692 domain-containing protein [Pseudocolwellia agarivorans]|uniref:DUF692 domain-containing protein n=1 Tax=Pseudocolwellia agarivorans TaxID=1911682 RepID=UPI003F884F84